MRQNHEHEQHLEEDRRDDEEVGGDKFFYVVLKESAPGLGWRLVVPDHVLSYGCLREFDSDLQQFSMNARCSPARVGQAHFGTYRRATFATPTLPTPIASETHAVPGDDRFGLEALLKQREWRLRWAEETGTVFCRATRRQRRRLQMAILARFWSSEKLVRSLQSGGREGARTPGFLVANKQSEPDSK